MTSFDRINSSSIDTQKELNFIFNGKKYTGFQGDTLASALIANGIKLIARSFKYHRPRGIISCGSQEPNGLVELIHKDFREPNTKATLPVMGTTSIVAALKLLQAAAMLVARVQLTRWSRKCFIVQVM